MTDKLEVIWTLEGMLTEDTSNLLPPSRPWFERQPPKTKAELAPRPPIMDPDEYQRIYRARVEYEEAQIDARIKRELVAWFYETYPQYANPNSELKDE